MSVFYTDFEHEVESTVSVKHMFQDEKRRKVDEKPQSSKQLSTFYLSSSLENLSFPSECLEKGLCSSTFYINTKQDVGILNELKTGSPVNTENADVGEKDYGRTGEGYELQQSQGKHILIVDSPLEDSEILNADEEEGEPSSLKEIISEQFNAMDYHRKADKNFPVVDNYPEYLNPFHDSEESSDSDYASKEKTVKCKTKIPTKQNVCASRHLNIVHEKRKNVFPSTAAGEETTTQETNSEPKKIEKKMAAVAIAGSSTDTQQLSVGATTDRCIITTPVWRPRKKRRAPPPPVSHPKTCANNPESPGLQQTTTESTVSDNKQRTSSCLLETQNSRQSPEELAAISEQFQSSSQQMSEIQRTSKPELFAEQRDSNLKLSAALKDEECEPFLGVDASNTPERCDSPLITDEERKEIKEYATKALEIPLPAMVEEGEIEPLLKLRTSLTPTSSNLQDSDDKQEPFPSARESDIPEMRISPTIRDEETEPLLNACTTNTPETWVSSTVRDKELEPLHAHPSNTTDIRESPVLSNGELKLIVGGCGSDTVATRGSSVVKESLRDEEADPVLNISPTDAPDESGPSVLRSEDIASRLSICVADTEDPEERVIAWVNQLTC